MISEPEPARILAPAELHELSVIDAPVMARHGPGLSYPIIGTLPKSVRVPIIGRSVDGKWWQIVFGTATDSFTLAWVSVTAMRTQGNESSVPQVWVMQEAQP